MYLSKHMNFVQFFLVFFLQKKRTITNHRFNEFKCHENFLNEKHFSSKVRTKAKYYFTKPELLLIKNPS